MTTAERRMFAKTIIDSDAFLDMPLSTQALYFHLAMRADDEGFVNNPKKIQRMVSASEDDLKVLATKRFIIPFESGVVVIRHWKIHNYIQNDRKHDTVCEDEKSLITVKKNGEYEMYTDCIQNGYNLDTEVSIGKVIDNNIDTNVSICQTERTVHSDIQTIVDAWNSLTAVGISPVSSMSSTSKRYKSISARIREYGVNSVLKAIDNVRESDFLQGKNNRNWMITFDWFALPNNFPKGLEGNYNRKSRAEDSNQKRGGDDWQ